MGGYVELHCHSAYSFLDGASHPEELVARAAELGYPSLALTDHDGVYGSLEFAHAAKHAGIRPITGAEVTIEGGEPRDAALRERAGVREPLPDPHRRPCRDAPSRAGGPGAPAARRRARDGGGAERGARLPVRLRARRARAPRSAGAARLAAAFGRERFFVELQRPYERGDARRHAMLRDLAERLGVETIATGNVHAHAPRRTLLQDALVAIRCRTSLDGCERERRGNREAVLRSPEEMVERFAGIDRAAAERTALLAERLTFDLTEELGYRYPDFSDRADPAIRQLAAICDHAFAERYSASDTVLRAQGTRPPGERARR